MTNNTAESIAQIALLELDRVTGGAEAFRPDSANQRGFSFIRAGRDWSVGQNGEVVGTIGANQTARIKGDHAFVQHDGPFPGGHSFHNDPVNGWRYFGSTR
jgi:hypothetical protein